jgi:integrase
VWPWGDGDDDERRHLLIDRNVPTMGDEGLPKSGRERRVAMSRRLREALFNVYRMRNGNPDEDRIFPQLATDPELKRWRRRVWAQVVRRAAMDR